MSITITTAVDRLASHLRGATTHRRRAVTPDATHVPTVLRCTYCNTDSGGAHLCHMCTEGLYDALATIGELASTLAKRPRTADLRESAAKAVRRLAALIAAHTATQPDTNSTSDTANWCLDRMTTVPHIPGVGAAYGDLAYLARELTRATY